MECFEEEEEDDILEIFSQVKFDLFVLIYSMEKLWK
jgi:hypothetical protein